jgi:signal transduction histidine kinase
VELRPVVTEAVDAARPSAEKAGHELKLRAERVARFAGDGERIGQVVDNLLSNAIKFTPPGGAIRVTTEAVDGRIHVHVRDTGPGLSPEELPQLFTGRKLSPRPTGGEPSTGLGLVITKRLVELHGGQIWVESTLGEGSVFSFSLPRALGV